jgi:hypothetical protein
VRAKGRISWSHHLGLLLVVTGFFFLAFQPELRAAQDSFTDRDATQLMQQTTAGLVAHNPGKMLSAFDLARMNDGALFEQNVLSFFSQTGTIRVHFNVLRTSSDGAKGIADVVMEMEAEMLDDRLPVLHKQAELHLVCGKTSTGWRITDLVPRDFFSIQP